MEQFAILRLNTIHRSIDDRLFDSVIQDLKHTEYKIRAKQEDAPRITHCISAIRYAIEKSTGIILPKLHIGDFCCEIYTSYNYLEPHILPISDHQRWDLLFFHKRSDYHKAYMITHVGIFLNEDGDFFHSNYPKWWKIDNIRHYLNKWSIATCKVLSNYTDPRRI
jgi:cell wall-associated NlpC family hydrolase